MKTQKDIQNEIDAILNYCREENKPLKGVNKSRVLQLRKLKIYLETATEDQVMKQLEKTGQAVVQSGIGDDHVRRIGAKLPYRRIAEGKSGQAQGFDPAAARGAAQQRRSGRTGDNDPFSGRCKPAGIFIKPFFAAAPDAGLIYQQYAGHGFTE